MLGPKKALYVSKIKGKLKDGRQGSDSGRCNLAIITNASIIDLIKKILTDPIFFN